MFSATSTIKGWLLVVVAAVALSAAGAALWAWNSFTTGLYDKGYAAGVASVSKVELVRLQEQNIALEVKQKELNDAAEESQTRYNRLLNQVSASERRRSELERVHKQSDKAFNSKLATASAESCRQFAEAAGDNFRRSVGHVRRFGEEAVRCSAAAHTAVKASPQTVVGEPPLPQEPEIPTPPTEPKV